MVTFELKMREILCGTGQASSLPWFEMRRASAPGW
jgi:hypothetical protein